MKTFYKRQNKIVFMIILTMLMQIVGPVIGEFSYAEDNVQKGFTFEVVQQEDGSGTFEWKYDPDKANDQRKFEIDLGIKLNNNFEGLLDDKNTEENETIGKFTISKDGLLKAIIYEVDIVEESIPEVETEIIDDNLEDVDEDKFRKESEEEKKEDDEMEEVEDEKDLGKNNEDEIEEVEKEENNQVPEDEKFEDNTEDENEDEENIDNQKENDQDEQEPKDQIEDSKDEIDKTEIKDFEIKEKQKEFLILVK